MKKILSIVIALLLFIPITVFAKVENVDFDIEAMYIDATVLDNGSMEVKELIVLDGSFNGYERRLSLDNKNTNGRDEINFEGSPIYNPTNIQLIGTSAKEFKNYKYEKVLGDFEDFDLVERASLGDNGIYTDEKNSFEEVIRTYNSCKNCTVGFYFNYLLEDVVVIHEDVAELYYNFIGEGFTEDIGYAEIRVHLPDETDEFRVWAHGNLQGVVNKKGDDEVVATIEKLKKRNSVDIRVVFDKDIITDDSTLSHTNVEALDEILKVEKVRADEANRQRERAKFIIKTIQTLSLLYLVSLIVFFIYIAIKYDKEYDSDFDHEYNRDFIDDYNVEVIDYLINKQITSNAMSASIMNMVYKKNIKAEILDPNKKKDYTFTLLNRNGLNATENKLCDFLFNKIGDDNKFTIKQLKDYAKSTTTCEKFTTSYESWKKMVIKDAEKQSFYESNTGIKIKGVLYGCLGILLFIISISSVEDFVPSHLIIIPAVAFIVYVLAFTKKTLKGINHYKRWTAFKRFLNDFGTFDTKELPEVALWERYLVYAVIFGLANKVQKNMNVKIKELEASGQEIYTGNLYTFNSINLSNAISSSVSNAVSSAVTTAVANSVSSSSSGGGGGFSSGGGFGGGGGGGSGF